MSVESTLVSRRLRKLIGRQTTTREYQTQETVFLRGDTADAMFYIQSGTVQLAVEPQRGKRAVIALLGGGDFFGEACLTTKPVHSATATTSQQSTIARIEREVVGRLIHQEPAFAKLFISYLLSRVVRTQEDLVDQLCNSSEKRLARVLLLLAGFIEQARPKPKVLEVSQGTLADMVGTTRSRVSFFMNEFRKRGFIRYDRHRCRIQVQRALLAFLKEPTES